MKRKGLSAPLVIVLLASQFILMALAVPAASYDDDLTTEYSVTTRDNYSNPAWNIIPPYGKNYVYPKTKYWLEDKNAWTKLFYWYDDLVWDIDYGKQTSGYQGLDEADYHIDVGHSGPDQITGETEIALYNWNFGNEGHDNLTGDLAWDEVYNKWELDNEWTFLYTCDIFNNSIGKWGAALNKSHIELGFETPVGPSYGILDTFYSQLSDNSNTIVNSYYTATTSSFSSDVRAVVVADTSDQFYYDHLWNKGEVKPDESPNDNIVYYADWNC